MKYLENRTWIYLFISYIMMRFQRPIIISNNIDINACIAILCGACISASMIYLLKFECYE